jgi:hypothetical protein
MLYNGLEKLTKNFRNRAAHIDELAKDDYLAVVSLSSVQKVLFGNSCSPRNGTNKEVDVARSL